MVGMRLLMLLAAMLAALPSTPVLANDGESQIEPNDPANPLNAFNQTPPDPANPPVDTFTATPGLIDEAEGILEEYGLEVYQEGQIMSGEVVVAAGSTAEEMVAGLVAYGVPTAEAEVLVAALPFLVP